MDRRYGALLPDASRVVPCRWEVDRCGKPQGSFAFDKENERLRAIRVSGSATCAMRRAATTLTANRRLAVRRNTRSAVSALQQALQLFLSSGPVAPPVQALELAAVFHRLPQRRSR